MSLELTDSQVAKVKAKKGKVEAETVGAAEARMEELRKKYVAANPYNEVPTNEQWIEVIGQALARERRFMTIMGNPPKLQDLTISRVWLASLHLPGRKDPLPARWIKWFKQVTDQAIARAVEIFQTCTASYQQTSAYRTAIDPPPDDEPTRKVRQQIFLYQTVRQRMGETVHQISKQEMILVQRVLAKNNVRRKVMSKSLVYILTFAEHLTVVHPRSRSRPQTPRRGQARAPPTAARMHYRSHRQSSD